VLSEGLGAILKFGIALMQRNTQTLLEMKDMVQLSTHLKERLFDVYIDKSPSATSILESGFFGSTSSGTDKEVYRADELVRDACAVTISPETLAAYTSEFEEQARLEKDREIELESLRNENTNLSTRVRKLELRTQESDAEHVDLASNLLMRDSIASCACGLCPLLLVNLLVASCLVAIELFDKLVDCRDLVRARIVASRRVLLLSIRHGL